MQQANFNSNILLPEGHHTKVKYVYKFSIQNGKSNLNPINIELLGQSIPVMNQ